MGPVGHIAFEEAVEAGGVVAVDQVAEFVEDDVFDALFGGLDQARVEG